MNHLFLKDIPMFSELKDDILEKITELMQKRIYRKNNVILMEEDVGDTLFFLNMQFRTIITQTFFLKMTLFQKSLFF